MSLPLLGPMTLSRFQHAWFFVFLLVVAAIVGLYIIVLLARRRRVLRFANMELLESVAPQRPTRWRHLPAVLLVISLVLFTIAMAGPTHDVRIPRNRAVVMLVIDVSQSMRATDVEPNRMVAAQEAAKQFADELTAGINLGLVAYGGTASVLVSPTTNRADGQTRHRQAAIRRPHRHRGGHLHGVAGHRHRRRGDRRWRHTTTGAHRSVLRRQRDCAVEPRRPQGGLHRGAQRQGARRADLDHQSFGTPYGYVEINEQRQPVPVDDETMKKVAALSGGTAYNASTISELRGVYATLQQQIGYETIPGDASAGWLRLGALTLALAVLAGLLINRRLPG